MHYLYNSTRNNNIKVSAKNAIKQGISDDGGLFVNPKLDKIKINYTKLHNFTFQETAIYILSKILPEFSLDEIKDSVNNAYNNNFEDPSITPVVKINNFYILELFHGPTSAFKDIGLQLLPQLMKHILNKKQKLMILTATSGDTGTAALQGFKDFNQIGITVFYPYQGISPIQQQQMLKTHGNNTKLAAIKGNFDDAQTTVKKIFNNQKLKKNLTQKNIGLSSANSINIGRLFPQIIYYFDSYKQLVDKHQIKNGEKINFTVPTGNFGDILAGYYAKNMGLPIKKLVIACNENNVLTQFFKYGIYNRKLHFAKTVAPSMDIQVSSNFERLLYCKSGQNAQYVKSLMNKLNNKGKYQVNNQLLNNIKKDFACDYSTNKQIKDTIHQVYQRFNYLMDPHTASGYHVMKKYQEQDPTTPMILLSTANPYKFPNVVAKAILNHQKDQSINDTKRINQFTGIKIPKNLQNFHNQNKNYLNIINKEEMKEYVQSKIKEVFNHDQS